MANPVPQSSASWVENALASLLSAPHISFPQAPSGIVTGPGPVDLFSTRFNNTFTSDARGSVDGKHVDRDGLKEKLLALQRHYNPDTVKFQSQPSGSHSESQDEVHISFTWTSSEDSTAHEVLAGAVVVGNHDAERISSLNLKGRAELFQNPGALSGRF